MRTILSFDYERGVFVKGFPFIMGVMFHQLIGSKNEYIL
jgi:hypothetical protein